MGLYTIRSMKIFIDSILEAQAVEGTYYPRNRILLSDIENRPEKYKSLFSHAANLKILNYLEECFRLDSTPYKTEYGLLKLFDGESFSQDICPLSEEQFRTIVRDFRVRTKEDRGQNGRIRMKILALNELSIYTKRGLYVLALRKLLLDISSRSLRRDSDVTICTEYTIDGVKQSIRGFLDEDEADPGLFRGSSEASRFQEDLSHCAEGS